MMGGLSGQLPTHVLADMYKFRIIFLSRLYVGNLNARLEKVQYDYIFI